MAAERGAGARRSVMRIVLAIACSASIASACAGDPLPPEVTGPAPDSFHVALETSRGRIVVEVHRAWSPHGADRFYQLVGEHFFDDERFFRVLPQYIAQFGLNDDNRRNEKWRTRPIPDDSLRLSNARGTLSFAAEGDNSRTHQLFFNIKDNARLDRQGFVPIARVVEGLAIVDSLYDGYDDAPKQTGIIARGNKYLAMFPKLDYIRTARMLP